MSIFLVFIIKIKNISAAGITTNIKRRLLEHFSRKNSSIFKIIKSLNLEFPDREELIERCNIKVN